MGSTLTNTQPKDTYKSLLKTSDSTELSATAKYVSDGNGNDSPLALSTTAIGIGTSTPSEKLEVDGNLQLGTTVDAKLYMLSTGGNGNNERFYIEGYADGGTYGGGFKLNTRDDSNIFNNAVTVNRNGLVGIGTNSPASLLTIQPANDASDTFRIYRGKDLGYESQSTIIDVVSGNTNIKSLATDAVRYISFQLSSDGGSSYTQAARIDFDGLKFGSDSAGANALDDYEEGTWTMGIAFGGASVGATYILNTGRYTKIGRQVTASGYLAMSAKGSSTGDATITGLPFTSGNTYQAITSASLRLDSVSFANAFQAYVDGPSTVISLGEVTEAGVASNLTNADFTDSSAVMVSVTYTV